MENFQNDNAETNLFDHKSGIDDFGFEKISEINSKIISELNLLRFSLPSITNKGISAGLRFTHYSESPKRKNLKYGYNFLGKLIGNDFISPVNYHYSNSPERPQTNHKFKHYRNTEELFDSIRPLIRKYESLINEKNKLKFMITSNEITINLKDVQIENLIKKLMSMIDNYKQIYGSHFEIRLKQNIDNITKEIISRDKLINELASNLRYTKGKEFEYHLYQLQEERFRLMQLINQIIEKIEDLENYRCSLFPRFQKLKEDENKYKNLIFKYEHSIKDQDLQKVSLNELKLGKMDKIEKIKDIESDLQECNIENSTYRTQLSSIREKLLILEKEENERLKKIEEQEKLNKQVEKNLLKQINDLQNGFNDEIDRLNIDNRDEILRLEFDLKDEADRRLKDARKSELDNLDPNSRKEFNKFEVIRNLLFIKANNEDQGSKKSNYEYSTSKKENALPEEYNSLFNSQSLERSITSFSEIQFFIELLNGVFAKISSYEESIERLQIAPFLLHEETAISLISNIDADLQNLDIKQYFQKIVQKLVEMIIINEEECDMFRYNISKIFLSHKDLFLNEKYCLDYYYILHHKNYMAMVCKDNEIDTDFSTCLFIECSLLGNLKKYKNEHSIILKFLEDIKTDMISGKNGITEEVLMKMSRELARKKLSMKDIFSIKEAFKKGNQTIIKKSDLIHYLVRNKILEERYKEKFIDFLSIIADDSKLKQVSDQIWIKTGIDNRINSINEFHELSKYEDLKDDSLFLLFSIKLHSKTNFHNCLLDNGFFGEDVYKFIEKESHQIRCINIDDFIKISQKRLFLTSIKNVIKEDIRKAFRIYFEGKEQGEYRDLLIFDKIIKAMDHIFSTDRLAQKVFILYEKNQKKIFLDERKVNSEEKEKKYFSTFRIEFDKMIKYSKDDKLKVNK